MEVGRHQGMMENEHILSVVIRMKKRKILNSFIDETNSIHVEIKCRLNTENSCYYSVQTLLSS